LTEHDSTFNWFRRRLHHPLTSTTSHWHAILSSLFIGSVFESRN